MAWVCGCGSYCNGVCGGLRFSDQSPGNVQRMEKTKHEPGVWAGARALIEHDDFPSLLKASKSRILALELNHERLKFQYAWKTWKQDLKTVCDKPNLPPSCERMVQVLHYHFGYEMERMIRIALQLARAVIELELRRSEIALRDYNPCTNIGSETSLMTRIRSAMKHKEQDVEKCIQLLIQRCYPLVVTS